MIALSLPMHRTNVVTMSSQLRPWQSVIESFYRCVLYILEKTLLEDPKERVVLLPTNQKEITFHLFGIGRPAHSYDLLKQN